VLDPTDLSPADEAVLDMLREGRVTAPFVRDETDYSLQYVRDVLSRLEEHGHVVKVHSGLYELVNDPREQA
jgi:predicted transcriptional regulator of viral defense system